MNKMYEYDFDNFNKANDTKIDDSRLASTPAKVDIFSEFEELDNIENNYNDEDLTLQTFEELAENNQNTENNNLEKLNNTLEIETITDEVIENYDKIINNTLENNNQMTIEKDNVKKGPMNIATAFINCSVLGFITIFFGYGIFFYIMSHI